MDDLSRESGDADEIESESSRFDFSEDKLLGSDQAAEPTEPTEDALFTKPICLLFCQLPSLMTI